MKKLPKWNPFTIPSEAFKYLRRTDFQNLSKAAYRSAQRFGILDRVCVSHKGNRKWNVFTLLTEALKYETRHSFQKHSNSAYILSRRYGIFDVVSSHMGGYKLRSDGDIRATAQNHQTRNSFRQTPEYAIAIRRGILEDVCTHMPKNVQAIEKYKNVKTTYYLTEMTDGNTSWVKPGLTTTTVADRYKGDKNIQIISLKEIVFEDGYEAWKMEQEALFKTDKNQIYRSNAEGPLKGGCTEIRDISSKEWFVKYFDDCNNK